VFVAAYWLSAVLDDGRSVLDDAGASANRRFGTQLLHWELLWNVLALQWNMPRPYVHGFAFGDS